MFARCGLAVAGALGGTLAAIVAMLPASAQEVAGLSPAEEQRALEIEASSKPPAVFAKANLLPALPGLASTAAGRLGKTVRPLIVPLEGFGKAGTRRAVVTRYDYASGLTTRTTVDLESGKAVYMRQDANYPTPLAKEEYEQALALARKANAELDAIIKSAAPDQLLITSQLPLYDNPRHPRYGHRLVALRVEAPDVSDRITVDLSTNEVVRGH